MHRIFLALAVTVGTLLVVSFGSGFLVPTGRGGALHDVHFLLSLITTMGVLLVHSVAFTYFLGTGKWVKEVVRVYRLPEWVHSQALKNKRKAFPFELGSMLFIGAAAWLGGASDTRANFDPNWHLGARPWPWRSISDRSSSSMRRSWRRPGC